MNEEDEALTRMVDALRMKREDGDPTRTEMGFMVILTVPARMTVEDVERDLRNSIEFGSPAVAALYDVPAPRSVDTATATGDRL